MLRKEYNGSDLAQLALTAGTQLPFLAVADFSPGPWWGFNGVQSLILTPERIFIVQRRLGGRAGRLRQSVTTGALRNVTWAVRRRLGKESITMTLTTEDGDQRYTSKWSNGLDFAEQAARQRNAV